MPVSSRTIKALERHVREDAAVVAFTLQQADAAYTRSRADFGVDFTATAYIRSRADYGSDYHQKRYGAYAVLWLRVYIRAVFDYVQYKHSKSIKMRREYECARRWLFDIDGGLDIICFLFGLPLDLLRDRARNMTKKDVKKLEHFERDGMLTRVLENGHR